MEHIPLLVIAVVAAALVFDFVNGFHDAANSIATIVVSRTLTPLQAVLLAGAANFIGYFAFGTAVAKMVGKGVVHLDQVTLPLLLATLVGAVAWNIITWFLGLPTSSSHALIGGLIGSGVVASGVDVVYWPGVLTIFAFIFVAPVLGGLCAVVVTAVTIWLFRRWSPIKAEPMLKLLQLVAALFSGIGHGTNDAQKSMGVITMALIAGGVLVTADFTVPNWVVLACYVSISLGTVAGGWRIVKTMGTSITKIRSLEGFCSGLSSAAVLMGTAHFGIPVSTTHVIAGSIMGVGSVEHVRSVRWVTARRILWAWLLTVPCAAAMAAATYLATAPMLAK